MSDQNNNRKKDPARHKVKVEIIPGITLNKDHCGVNKRSSKIQVT